jgi:hypothetical protein
MLTADFGGTGGNPIESGLVVEEPDIEIGAGVSSKGRPLRPRREETILIPPQPSAVVCRQTRVASKVLALLATLPTMEAAVAVAVVVVADLASASRREPVRPTPTPSGFLLPFQASAFHSQ